MNPNRPDALTDLTRWNRAGLSRLQYVDGDAASWLEELRLALFSQYLRGAEPEDRLPERWRDVFLVGRPAGGDPSAPPLHPDLMAKPNATWPDATLMGQAAAVQWSRLAPKQPPRVETPGQRQARLLAQYTAAPDGDPAWEITRAFARATHLVLGHLNAFAGEGYLRTATQWDNLRRLAAMVNYQPGPPASALTEAALSLKAEAGAVVLTRGLASKYAPPTGGAPLIFETLADLSAHPALNALRPVGWDVNATPLLAGPPGAPRPLDWLAGPKVALAPGDLVVLAWGTSGRARSVVAVEPLATGLRVTLDDGINASPPTHEARLWISPAEVRRGEAQTGGGRIVVEVAGLPASAGDVLRIRQKGASSWSYVDVLEAKGGTLLLRKPASLDGGEVELQALSPLSADGDGWVNTSTATHRMWFADGQGVSSVRIADDEGFRVNSTTVNEVRVTTGFGYQPAGGKARRGFIASDAEVVPGKVRPEAVQVVPGTAPDAARTVTFTGKPPKGLAAGAWMVGRQDGSGALQPLRVVGVTQAPGLWHVLFHADVQGAHDRVEFHGPMTTALLPEGHDLNPEPAAPDGTILVPTPPEAALALLKPGRRVILGPPGAEIATALTGIERQESGLRISVAAALPEAWVAHETFVRLNVATLGHGESKGSRLLGSGDAERPEQVFRLAVKEISHIPGAVVVAGVVPDVEVAVEGRVWGLSDLTDPAADGTQTWSPALNEDGELMIHFRRRLPTGSNNVTVLRHRVGTGAMGSGVPAFALKEPMRKHPFVTALYQPFPSAGGADRESVAAMRVSTPSRLSANGRAVSAADLGRVAESHAQVWKAKAEELTEPGRLRRMRLTLVAANGDPLTPALTEALRPAILARAVPGISLSFADFGALPLHLVASVRADLTSFDKGDVEAACIDALGRAFALSARGFGQPVYLAEILAALEAVPEVETATVQSLGLGQGVDLTQPKPGGFAGEWPAHVAIRDGGVAAIFPSATQVAFVPLAGQPFTQGTVSVTVQDTRP